MPDIVSGPVFVGVMTAVGQHRQLPPGQVAIEGEPLFHVKDRAAVRVQDQGGAGGVGNTAYVILH